MKNKKQRLGQLLGAREVESWRALMNAFQTLYRSFDEALLKDGCTYSRFQLLFFLYFEGSLAPVEISKKMLVTRSNITMFLRRMIADDLVTECPESLSIKRPCYMLTAQGKQFFENIFPNHIQRVRTSMPILPTDSIKILRTLASD
ncbi:MAG: MarR family winged helix-turn-helix transcriptional regulator [Pseudomonadota bacterium]|nr:MarR family winged helix-turn-helix transcriptional regulator [Pseudomonadota bacterium]